MMYNRGNGYYECERGRFETSLVYDGKEVARTYGDIIIAYDKQHSAEVEELAQEYDLRIEWK